jgi:hypothetical protein
MQPCSSHVLRSTPRRHFAEHDRWRELARQQSGEAATIAVENASSGTCIARNEEYIHVHKRSIAANRSKQSKRFAANLIAVGVVLTYRMPAD